MNDTRSTGDFSKGSVWASTDTSHCGIICKRAWGRRAGYNASSGLILSKCDRLSRALTNTHPGRIISKESQLAVLYTNIVVPIHAYSIVERTKQNTFISRVICEVRRNACLLAGTSWILGIVAVGASDSTVLVGQVGVIRRRTVDNTLPGRLVCVHNRSTTAVLHTIMSSIVSKQIRRTKLYTCSYI